MDHIEYPLEEVWKERRDWFERLAEPQNGGYLLGEQSTALVGDIQSAFCAGAWIAVVIMTAAAIDGHLREVEFPDAKGNAQKLIDQSGGDSRLHSLRKRRNALVHVNPANAAITVDQQYTDRNQLEQEARSAVRLMFEVIYAFPST
ncbi:MAG TPA: hypothetical protein VGK36_07170 [Candidatus Angelobacter sp.]|jgi:hypothetical protein